MRDYDAIKEALTFYAATAETTRKTRALLDAADAIEELVAKVPKWISVEDDLPKANDRVIACVNILGEPSVWDAVRWNGEEWEAEEETVYEYWTSIDHPVTHWMPLPVPPKEDA